MKPAIAIFVKTPGHLPLKTRLASGFGEENTLNFYLKCLEIKQELASVMQNDVDFYWAVGEEEALDHPLWHKLSRLWTGEGGLGERMAHVYNILSERHSPVIIIGADTPQLTKEMLNEAISRATWPKTIVLGPAVDGGFYLIGGSSPIATSVWVETPYSSSKTYSEITKHLLNTHEIDPIQRLTDVDEKRDLYQLQKEWREPMLPSQINMQKWLCLNISAKFDR